MKAKHLFVLLFCSIVIFHAHANTLITTRGPVCSGMGTYLAHAIKAVDNSYYTISQNDIYNALYYQMLSLVFPDHMSLINVAIDEENIIPAIANYHIYFKETADESHKLHAMVGIDDIRHVLNNQGSEKFLHALSLLKGQVEMAELAYHAACGHNVIWERRANSDWDYETAEIEELFDNVCNTVTYCPPTTMIEQWLHRNNHAIKTRKAFERRFVKQILMTFFRNFQQVSDEYQEVTVVLTRNEFDTIINQAADYIQTVPQDESGFNGEFTSTEFTLEELFNFKAHLYAKFDFDNVDAVALAPTLTHDVLLRSKENCLDFAQALVSG